MAKIAAQTAEPPDVVFVLEMRESLRGVWRRRVGTWVSTTAWTIDLNQDEYEALNRYIAALRGQKARKVASHAA